jgi:hypothetical protein
VLVDTATRDQVARSVRTKALAEMVAYGAMFALAVLVSEAVAYWGVLCALCMAVERYRGSFRL